MAPQLLALTEGPHIAVDKPILLLGRHQECDVQIPSRKISRRHCCIAQIDDHLVIRDLFSTNGIRVNGLKMSEGILRDGDEVTIGNMSYRVQFAEKQSEPRMEGSMRAKPEPPARNREDAGISLDNPVVIFDSSDSAPIGLPIVLPVNRDQRQGVGFSDDFGNLPINEAPRS
jgi:pSer/pThr/pTyr-binding forkhead associated (FHA) protein